MRGHLSLLKARMQRHEVADVFVNVLANEPDLGMFADAENSFDLTGHPEIDIAPTDSLDHLDLRCLHGLCVHVLGKDKDRTMAAARRIKEFSPSEILASGPADMAILRWKPKQ